MKLNISKSLENSIGLLKERKMIFVFTFIFSVISLVLTTLFQTYMIGLFVSSAMDMANLVKLIAISVASGIISAVIGLYVTILVIKILDSKKMPKDLFVFGLKKFPIVFLASILFSIIFFVGGLVFYSAPGLISLIIYFIPAIYFALRLQFYTYAMVVDNEGIINSFKKSWKMTTGNWWRIFAISLATVIISGVVFAFFYFLDINIPATLGLLTPMIIDVVLAPWMLAVFYSAYKQLR